MSINLFIEFEVNFKQSIIRILLILERGEEYRLSRTHVLWKEAGYLSEIVLSEMHICPIFDLGTKVRISKVRQNFQGL